MDRLFGEFLPSLSPGASEDFFTPRVDVKELDGHYEITAELPGVAKEDIHVHVQDGVLSLEAETSSDSKKEEKGKWIRQERRYGRYVRTFQLGKGVQESDIQASFKDGILHLRAPKASAETHQPRKIQIS
ncbi:MAG: Hsp20/alpha crystallin family protein [Planctomycetota bacterium]